MGGGVHFGAGPNEQDYIGGMWEHIMIYKA